MEEVLHGSLWSTICPLLNADDVVRLRVAATCWNEGRRNGKMGDIFFQLLHSDIYAKHWYYDDVGYKLCTLRYPIMESFRKWELQGSKKLTSPLEVCSYDGEVMSLVAEGRMHQLSKNQCSPNAMALTRCRAAACHLAWVKCGIMGTL